MAQSIVDELVTLLGFKVDPNAHPTAAKFTRSIDEISKYALAASASIMAAAASLLYFAEKSAHAGAEIERFHQLTGMSTDSIQQWSYAAQQISGDKQGILNDIQSITSALNPIMPGDYNQGLYLMFGSRMKDFKDANQVFQELSKVFQKMTPQKALQWGKLIGLDPHTVMTLRSGDLQRALKEAKGAMITPKEAEEAYQFAQKWDAMWARITKTTEKFAIKFFPIIEKVMTRLMDWYDHNQKFINSNFEKFVQGITNAVMQFSDVLSRLKGAAPWVRNLFDLIMDPRIISGVALTALGGMAVVLGIIAAKYALIGGAILAIIGAVEDFGSSLSVDKNGEIGPSGKDTYLNHVLDWVHDHLPEGLRTPESEWKRAGSAPGKSKMKEVVESLADMYRNAQTVELPSNRSSAPQTSNNNVMNQNVNVNIQSTDPYGAGRETVYQLERMASPALAGTWR